jgi:hypothetical protein
MQADGRLTEDRLADRQKEVKQADRQKVVKR